MKVPSDLLKSLRGGITGPSIYEKREKFQLYSSLLDPKCNHTQCGGEVLWWCFPIMIPTQLELH